LQRTNKVEFCGLAGCSFRAFFAALAAAGLLVVAGCQGGFTRLDGQCGDYPCCWSRDAIRAELSKNHILKGVELKSYAGEIAVHDPANWWTKSRITGESCSFVVAGDGQGRTVVEASFLPEPVVLSIPMSDVNFYMGQVNEDQMIVLQQHPAGASLSWSNFNEKGFLNYGDCSDDGYFIKECARY